MIKVKYNGAQRYPSMMGLYQGYSLSLPPLQTDFGVLKGGGIRRNFFRRFEGGVSAEKFSQKL